MQDLVGVVWAQRPRGTASLSEVSCLTALTSLQLVPVIWPWERQKWLEWPLVALTNLQRLSLLTPSSLLEACIDTETIMATFGSFSKLRAVNCAGLRITGAEAAAVGRRSGAGLWQQLIELSAPDETEVSQAAGPACLQIDAGSLLKRNIEVFYDNEC